MVDMAGTRRTRGLISDRVRLEDVYLMSTLTLRNEQASHALRKRGLTGPDWGFWEL